MTRVYNLTPDQVRQVNLVATQLMKFTLEAASTIAGKEPTTTDGETWLEHTAFTMALAGALNSKIVRYVSGPNGTPDVWSENIDQLGTMTRLVMQSGDPVEAMLVGIPADRLPPPEWKLAARLVNAVHRMTDGRACAVIIGTDRHMPTTAIFGNVSDVAGMARSLLSAGLAEDRPKDCPRCASNFDDMGIALAALTQTMGSC